MSPEPRSSVGRIYRFSGGSRHSGWPAAGGGQLLSEGRARAAAPASGLAFEHGGHLLRVSQAGVPPRILLGQRRAGKLPDGPEPDRLPRPAGGCPDPGNPCQQQASEGAVCRGTGRGARP